MFTHFAWEKLSSSSGEQEEAEPSDEKSGVHQRQPNVSFAVEQQKLDDNDVDNNIPSMVVPVRALPDSRALVVRTLEAGDLIRVMERRLCSDCRLRLFVGDGWVDAGSDSLATNYVEECDAPEGLIDRSQFRVVAPEGLVLRLGCSLKSDAFCTVPTHQIIEVVERRRAPDGTMRLRLAEGGWASERMRRASGVVGPKLVATLQGASGESLDFSVEGVLQLKVIAPEGLVVRSGLELSSEHIRTMPCGQVFKTFSRRINKEHIARFRISDGWVSERARGPQGAPGEFLVEPADDRNSSMDAVLPSCTHPTATQTCFVWWFRVVDPEGLVVRCGPSFDSDVLRTLPFGAIVQATEQRARCEGIVRVRLASGGWVSEGDLDDILGDDTAGGYSGTRRRVEQVEAPEGARRLWYRVLCDEGLTVRRGLEPSSEVLCTLPPGDMFEVSERRRSWSGLMQIYIEAIGGWASERPACGGHALVAETAPPEAEGRFWYTVVASGGVVVTAQKSPTSEHLRYLCRGTVFEASLRVGGANGSLSLHVGDGWVQARESVKNGLGATHAKLLAVPAEVPFGAGHFWYHVIVDEGLLVRRRIDLGSEAIRRIPWGSTFKVTCRAKTKEGIIRLCVGDGWVSERVTNSDWSLGAPMAELTNPPEGPGPFMCLVLRPSGVSIHSVASPSAPEVRKVEYRMVFMALERRKDAAGRTWLRVEGGWTRERIQHDEAAGALQVVETDCVEDVKNSWCRVVAPFGITVRQSSDVTSKPIGRLSPGALVEVIEHKQIDKLPAVRSNRPWSLGCGVGLMRLNTHQGWLSERAVDDDGFPAELLVEPAFPPTESDLQIASSKWRRVVAPDGLVVRCRAHPSSEPLRVVPCGEVVEVIEVLDESRWIRIAGGWAESWGQALGAGEEVSFLSCPVSAPEGKGHFWYRVAASSAPGYRSSVRRCH